MGLHTGTWPGKIVRVRLSNGEVFYDRFVDRVGGRKFVQFERRGKIPRSGIRSFTPICDNWDALNAYLERTKRI